MPDFDTEKLKEKKEKFHDRIKQRSLSYEYFIFPTAYINEVNAKRRKLVKEKNLRYVCMINHNDIYLLIFRKKNK